MKRCEICLQLKDAGEIVQMPSDEFVLTICRECHALIRTPEERR